MLSTLVEQIKALSAQIGEQLAAHADAHIFTSLPRSGTVRAARLLAEIGDCRARFPTPEALACLAGVAPSTRQSGKTRSVGFRWACDKQLRDAVTDFAGDTRRANPWAADLYHRARARGHDHPHAVRILARAWLYVIWHCWQDGVAYDPAQHGALQRLLNQDQQAGGLTQGSHETSSAGSVDQAPNPCCRAPAGWAPTTVHCSPAWYAAPETTPVVSPGAVPFRACHASGSSVQAPQYHSTAMARATGPRSGSSRMP